MTRLALFSLLILSTACIKTADQVNREKKFEAMTEQLKDSQGLMAQMVERLKDLQSQVDRMNGRIEEMEHKTKKLSAEEFAKNNETLTHLKTQQESESTQLLQIQNELKENRAYMEKVTAALASLKDAPAPKESKGKKKSPRAELNDGLDLIKADKFDDARSGLESLIDNKDLTPGDINKLYHGLGRVEYYTKNYDKALVYFSKIFAKYPKASLAPSSLLFIGRTLEKLGKKAEAKEAFTKVTEDYPGTKEASEAKKEI